MTCSQLAVACGGHTAKDTDVVETVGTTNAASGGTAGTQTNGTGGDFREAAHARAARFVNDYEVTCAQSKQIFFGDLDSSEYEVRVLQSRGRPGPYLECAQLADLEEKLACWQSTDCSFDWWDELDWSQWTKDATVVEIVGPKPEQINVALSSLRPLPGVTDPAEPVPVLTSFYERTFEEPVPPGCHDCGYYWYLDPTPEGVAVVLSNPLAGDMNGSLSSYEFRLCLTE